MQPVGVVVVGAHSGAYIMKCRRLPTPGEYLIAEGYSRSLDGGKASNQALAVARLGGLPHLVTRIGNDEEGNFFLEFFRRNGIDVSNVSVSPEAATAKGIAFVDRDGTPLGATDPGALLEMTREHIDQAGPAFERSKVLLTQLEIASDLALYACELGKRHGLLTILNPAPADDLAAEDISNVDILTPNEPEAKLLAGYRPDDEVPVDDLARTLRSKSKVATIVITLGSKGAIVADENGLAHFPCPKVQPVDTSGAGDCFNAAFAVALGQGVPLPNAVVFAIRAASMSVTKAQVWPSYPARQEVLEVYGSLW